MLPRRINNHQAMISIARYSKEKKSEWDHFIQTSRNGTFLFLRDYMDYHSDRFVDCSLMAYEDGDSLVAVFPAASKDSVLSSHSGLTFGGLVYNHHMKAELMLVLFDALLDFLRTHDFKRLVYKAIPHIYHRIPSEEDLYALFRNNAKLFRRDLSSTIRMTDQLTLSKGRRYALKQAERNKVVVETSADFESFMKLEAETLEANHQVRPVHSGDEMNLLAARFPDNIKLHLARHESKLVAGVLTFETDRVVHAQYIAASDLGKQIGALDSIINSLIKRYAGDKEYFDFGISTEKDGTFLNTGLIANKESFGARAIAYDSYELELSS